MTMSDTDVRRIKEAVHEAERVRQRIYRLVQRAREKGATWTEVGYALGTTSQAAQQRFGNGDERSEAFKARAAKRAAKKAAKHAGPKS